MSRLTIYQDNYADATVISNRFIDEHMKSANDAQLKIYLYLVRMMNARRSTSISEIADVFNYTEKDVLRALKYWEQNHLLALDYDDAENPTGIHFLDLNAPSPVPASVETFTHPTDVVAFSYKLNTGEKETMEPLENTEENPYEKPAYTAAQLKAFKTDESTSRVLFIAEQYLKKTLSPDDMKSIIFISDKLGFSEDLIDYLIQYCVDHGRKSLRYIEKIAVDWAQEGITMPKQAAAYVHKYDKTVYNIMNALGKSTMPTQTEVTYITRWTKEYGFEFDVISVACERAVLATDKHRFEYADSILRSWCKEGVRHKRDIQAADANFQRNKAARASSNNKFNQFKQNQYDFDLLEKELLSN